MKKLQLLAGGKCDARLLEWLRQALHEKFRVPAEILPPRSIRRSRCMPSGSSITPPRSSPACSATSASTWRLLGITGLDLYIPILTFVFGEAQMGGPCAIVSYHRLAQEFYGLPARPRTCSPTAC